MRREHRHRKSIPLSIREREKGERERGERGVREKGERESER